MVVWPVGVLAPPLLSYSKGHTNSQFLLLRVQSIELTDRVLLVLVIDCIKVVASLVDLSS